jgi:terminase small subunit / prophage DNA-packing protein
VIDLEGIPTQSQLGELVGISQPAVSGLVQRGVLIDGDTLGAWLLAYCDHIREMAAGRAAGGGLDLGRERARLASEQADRVAMQNAEKRRELAPVHIIEEVLSKAGTRGGKILETIVPEIKRRLPLLTSDDLKAVESIVAKARNIAASMSMADLDIDESEEGSDAVEISDAIDP